ncbi:MAG: hypothetical protein PHW69_06560 [Elusimicrobiaceae bacterium]|nr:hypothetical protein [Elusimicrobiaceae bacterium]
MAVLFLALAGAQVFAASYKTSENELELDVAGNWKTVKKDDPDNILSIASGNNSISLIRRADELSERYLKMRLEEALEGVRAKGARPDGIIVSLDIHGAARFHYTLYSVGSDNYIIGIFTYAGKSFDFEGRNLDSAALEELVWSIRSPGEKVKPREIRVAVAPEPVKPVKRAKKSRKPQVAAEPVAPSAEPVPVSTSVAAPVTAERDIVIQQRRGLGPPVTTVMPDKLDMLLKSRTRAARQTALAGRFKVKPFLQRRALSPGIAIVGLAVWLIGLTGLLVFSRPLGYPKLSPPPKDPPPDWFFPFTVVRGTGDEGILYRIRSRHGQILKARFESHGHGGLVFGVYGILVLHAVWSLCAATPGWAGFTARLAEMPLGGLVLSLPELPFLLVLIWSLFKRMVSSQKLFIYDKDDLLVLQARPFGGSVLFSDGKGKEVGRLRRTAGKLFGRRWRFSDSDGQESFVIKDDHPVMLFARRLFGNLGGKLSGRYSFFAKDARAGFVLNDPTSVNGFQYHCDYGFARLARPLHIVGALLYAQSSEIDYRYPWI